MCTDEIDDSLGQQCLFSDPDSIGDMIYDHFGTLVESQLAMWIHTTLVFGEESRVCHLPNIMIHGSCTDQLGICSDFCSGFRCQDRDLQGMLECSGRCFRQLFKNRRIDIG